MVWLSTILLGWFARMESVQKTLLESARASQGEPGKYATIQSKGNSGDSSKHGNAECPANPLLNPKSTLHRRKYTATGEQRNRQRSRGAAPHNSAGGWPYGHSHPAGRLR